MLTYINFKSLFSNLVYMLSLLLYSYKNYFQQNGCEADINYIPAILAATLPNIIIVSSCISATEYICVS